MGKLQDKVVIITGGVSGIGAATARLFAQEGAKLILVDQNGEKGRKFELELITKGYDVIFIQADVTNVEQAQHVFEVAKEKFGPVAILFNNAGIGYAKPTEEITYAEYRRTVEIDLDAYFLYAQLAIKDMLKNGGGVIVNTSAIRGIIGGVKLAALSAAKGGVINLTRALALEFAERHIRVNALCPGYTDTPGLGVPQVMRATLAATIPMKRLGTPEEMAKAALFLASDDSSFMTGNILTIDGGYTAQ